MNESGIVRNPVVSSDVKMQFSDLQSITPNTLKALSGGKFYILKTAKSSDAASLQLLRREYALSCNLIHPYISSALLFLEDSPVGPAILMEYVEGMTLREFITNKPDSAAKRKVFSQILDAVEYIHAKGLLHNDIKPENILVTTIGNDVKIIDFGLSENDSDYLNRHLGGTPASPPPK